MTSPHLLDPPDVVWRVARLGMGLMFSEIQPAEARSGRAGNRFDVLGGGVLYASTDIEGCYRETLARLRPAPGTADLDEEDSGYMRAGQVAASWRENRRRFALSMVTPLPFVDLEHQRTWNALATDGVHSAESGHPAHLDVGHVRGPDRLLTRAIASWAHTRVDGNGLPLYSGIRYMSRTGGFECWAIFNGTEVVEAAPPGEIELNDTALRRVAVEYGLTLH